MTPSYRAALVAAPLVLALGLGLAGCTGDDSGGGELSEEQSPLAAYMQALYGGNLSPEEQEDKWRAELAETEERVAECMAKEGFEYVPSGGAGVVATMGDEWKPDSKEWVSQYGYGIVDSPSDDGDGEATGAESKDPNAAYVESLSESEQLAYYETLYGPAPSEDELKDGGDYDWETAGCFGAAQRENSGDRPEQAEQFAPLIERINNLYTEAQDAPEMAELDAEWASCMADAGHGSFTRQAEAEDSIRTKVDKLYEAADPETGEPAKAERDALSEEEVGLALADLTCREKVDYRQKALKVQFELEERFIADNKAELDALKAAAEQAN